jgi:AcrR family transcriptional regulator
MKNNEKKNQILKAASKRFSKLGYHKTTLEEVARDLRIGKATIYHYFTSKDDLYFAVLSSESDEIIEKIKSIFNDESIEIVERFIRYFQLKESLFSENNIVTNLIVRKVTNDTTEKETEIVSKLLNDEREVIKLVISFIYREQIEKYDESIPLEIVYLSWVIAMAGQGFLRNNKPLNEDRMKSIIRIYLPNPHH